jgi:hypothetical protein
MPTSLFARASHFHCQRWRSEPVIDGAACWSLSVRLPWCICRYLYGHLGAMSQFHWFIEVHYCNITKAGHRMPYDGTIRVRNTATVTVPSVVYVSNYTAVFLRLVYRLAEY